MVCSCLVLDSAHVKVVRAEETAQELLQRAAQTAAKNQSEEAVGLLTRAIAFEPNLAEAYYLRGRENFRRNQIDASVRDFEKFLELRPDRKSSLWELGISYYYAGNFDAGAKQFEMYQTFDNNDVENAVWRFLCSAPQVGLAAAREELLPIANDPRIPLMAIYALYQGRKTPHDVLTAAREGNPPPEALKTRMFYAHLYLGLFFEATGDREAAKPHVAKAATEYRINHYMGDVARVHHERLTQTK